MMMFVNFLRIFSTKSTISQKLKIVQIEKKYLICFTTLCIFLDQKPNLATFRAVGVSISITRNNPLISRNEKEPNISEPIRYANW